MCHRYIQTSELGSLRQALSFLGTVKLTPRHNICPQQQVPVIYPGEAGNRLGMMHWGLRSKSWSNPPVTEIEIPERSPEPERSSADASQASLLQRCLIPADGFYECEKRAGQALQPWLVRLIEDGPFFFAGIWQTVTWAEGRRIRQCALLTVMDNGTIAPLATRVPVILAKQNYTAWLDPGTSMEQLRAMLKPYRESGIYWHPVSQEILDSEHDLPSLAEPAQLTAA